MARIQIISIIISSALLVVIFELVRQRKLMERYAILWLATGLVLLFFSVWRGALEKIAHLFGIFYPPSALFVIAAGLIIVLLIHFSLVISRLADQTKVLAQKLGLLETRVAKMEGAKKPVTKA